MSKKEEKKEKIKEEEKEEVKLSKKEIEMKALDSMSIEEIRKENRKYRRRSSRNKFFAILFLLILFFIFGVVSGVYVCDRWDVSLFEFDKKVETTKEENAIEEKEEEVTPEEKEVVTFDGNYVGEVTNEETNLKMTLVLNSNYSASLTTILNGEVIEISEGTYIVDDDELTYNRIYAKGGNDQNNISYLVKINSISTSNYKYSNSFDNSRTTEVFTIKDSSLTNKDYVKLLTTLDEEISLNK